MWAKDLKAWLKTEEAKTKLKELYVDEQTLPLQLARYEEAIDKFLELYGDGDLHIYSAPGRSEVGGNHTDHQRGKVLACSINLDNIAVVKKTEDNVIRLQSKGFYPIRVDLSVLTPQEKETDHSPSLIRGVAAAFHENGYQIGGFEAYTTSQVLTGSGMSSSASFEILLATILNDLYNDNQVSDIDKAKFSQYAENKFYGKPSGLLDQMASSVGSLINIDFKDKENPIIKRIDVNFRGFGYALCVTDTRSSHNNLTDEYAAVPGEMKQVAAYFGKEVLSEVDEQQVKDHLNDLRKKVGDRPVLRALHFYEENKRVDREVAALEQGDFKAFLKAVTQSGNSSYKYLQNIYASKDQQGVSMALALTDLFLEGEGAHRVHGGGFAGTIQAFVPIDKVEAYRREMDSYFGDGACHVMYVRNLGGTKVL